MANGNYNGANKALETMCKIAGVFDNTSDTKSKQSNSDTSKRNNVEAFKEDNLDETQEEKIKRLQKMLQSAKGVVS